VKLLKSTTVVRVRNRSVGILSIVPTAPQSTGRAPYATAGSFPVSWIISAYRDKFKKVYCNCAIT
jgi:hypothetical protein